MYVNSSNTYVRDTKVLKDRSEQSSDIMGMVIRELNSKR